jgi:hypothetical protein
VQVRHPNVVQTYKSACVRQARSEYGGGGNGDDGSAMVETWMLLEFCNKGSMSDAVDKGYFHSRANAANTVQSGRNCILFNVLTTAREVRPSEHVEAPYILCHSFRVLALACDGICTPLYHGFVFWGLVFTAPKL